MNPIEEYFYRLEEPARSTLLFFKRKNPEIRHGKYHRNVQLRIAFFQIQEENAVLF
ncbi:hypothetical protein [Chryseobacterium nepalense]|uniref:hypothetical protein n=1 Tax=Chryseobacterium nepalense TaxID=1854498 RepID=UPI002DFF61B6|nr:hypothetical protein [Chryseobacterium nepalense]